MSGNLARRALMAIRLEIPGEVADDFIPIMKAEIERADAAEAENERLRAQVERVEDCLSLWGHPAIEHGTVPYRTIVRRIRRALDESKP